MDNVAAVCPDNYGWLEYKLSDKEMDYVWRRIDKKKGDAKHNLAGNITGSYSLVDRSDWFYLNVIQKLILLYADTFDNLGNTVPVSQTHPYYMNSWWVNFQKQHEFNPNHNHGGVYSFVIWMKIPTDYEDQKKLPIASTSNSGNISNFEFHYSNIFGETTFHTYRMSPDAEGTMLFFPSKLKHNVYPFYNCDEERISVSGNVMLNSSKLLSDQTSSTTKGFK